MGDVRLTAIDLFLEPVGSATASRVRLVTVNLDDDKIATHRQNLSWAEQRHAKIDELGPY